MKTQEFPWTLVPALLFFAVGFILQFKLRTCVDRAKLDALTDVSGLFGRGVPPRNIMNETGQKLYPWFYGSMIGFVGSVVLTGVLYGQ